MIVYVKIVFQKYQQRGIWMPKKPIKIKKKPKDRLIYIYGDEMSDVWEHFNMSVRDDDDRIVLKFVRYESRDSYVK